MRATVGLRIRLVLAGLVALSVGMSGGVPASAVAEDRLLPPTATPAGTFGGVPYVRYDGIFEGETSTGAFRVPYRITSPVDPTLGNGTVIVEPSHRVVGLGVLDLYLRPDLLFTRGFALQGSGGAPRRSGPGPT